MRLNSYIIWVLCALLMMASLDAIPDPPAIDQHAVKVVSPQVCKASSSAVDRRLNCTWNCPFSNTFQVRWVTLTSSYEPNLPSDWIVLTGQAADPSPPTMLKAPGKLYFRS
jgi:hypothetical protein